MTYNDFLTASIDLAKMEQEKFFRETANPMTYNEYLNWRVELAKMQQDRFFNQTKNLMTYKEFLKMRFEQAMMEQDNSYDTSANPMVSNESPIIELAKKELEKLLKKENSNIVAKTQNARRRFNSSNYKQQY